jgi:hypothetical protein
LLEDEEDDDDDAIEDLTPVELAQYMEEKRRKRAEEIEKFLEKTPDYEDAVVKEGDYTIQVHIIEVADIKGYNASGLSDPFCVLEVFGQKQKTRVIKESSQCFFDETFYFNFKDVKREQLAEGSLKVTVYDHNWFRANELIGQYQIDLQTVYNNPDHEMYRQWAALRNPNLKDEIASQGNLKFTCVVLGPGDAQKVHDPSKEEDDDEKDLELKEGILQPSLGDGVTQTLQFLVISLLKADGLPGFDRFISSSKNGLYAYVKLEYAGLKPLKTSKVFVTGKKNLSVSFDEELWIPVWLPTMCQKAKLTIFNREFGRKDLLLATAYVDVNGTTRLETDPVISTGVLSRKKYEGPMFQWLHLYGANPLVRGSTQASNFMNRFPNYGSAYRGSLLVGTRLVKYSNTTNLPHVTSINYDIPESKLPKQSFFLFRVMIYQGSDFGSKGQASRGREGNYMLSIAIGPHELRSSFRTYVNGAVDWCEVLELANLPLPALEQMPDTIITVYRGSPSSYTSVAFVRLNTVELLAKQAASDALWYELKHDQSHKSNSTLGYPGAALLKMALINTEEAANFPDWENERKKLDNRKAYALRVFVYQGRNLPAVDDNGMIDPYVKVRFCGQKKKTMTKSRTQNPSYYEVLTFETMLPNDLTLAPNVLLQVWDSNTFSNAPIAAFRVRVADIPKYNTFLVPPLTPTWRELYGIDGKTSMGEVLCSFQLFEKKSAEQVVPLPDPILPALRKAYIDVHVIGLRELTRAGSRNIKKPYLQFDVASQSYGESFQFGASRVPSATNPNYLDRHMTMINLPEDPLYTPTLEVKVYDEKLTGSSLIGVCNISLLSKLPWNGDEYVPPRQHLVLEDNVKYQKQLAKKRLLKENQAKNIPTPQQGSLTAAELEEDVSEENPTRRVQDSGLGIFPVDDTAREPGAKYSELPMIVDDDEKKFFQDKKRYLKELKKKRRQMKKSSSASAAIDFDDDVDADGAYDNLGHVDLDSTENINDLKRIIGIPSGWTSTDFLTGREWWISMKSANAGGNLENYLETYPFENYEVYRGHVAFNKFGKRKETKQKVGLLKAVVRICVRNPLHDDEYNKFAKSMKAVTNCVLRLYVIKATNLQPQATGSFFQSKADPYLKITFGNKEEKDLKTMNKKTLSPEFYSCYEFQSSIPGPSSLRIQIYDHKKFFGSDVLMGETVIDCEDRFFHPKWTSIGDIKPVEQRNLYKIGSTTSQGVLMMWLDILPAADAQNIPPVKIAGPEKLKFEIRVICWRSKDVVQKGGLKDLYGQFYLEGDGQPRHTTDTHWRCKSGNASWNYRIKIPVELPIKARELGRLHIQLWDANLITSNEIIGEATFNLYDWFVLAYHRKAPVFPFKEIKAAKARQQLGFPVANGAIGDSFFPVNLALPGASDDLLDEDEDEDDEEMRMDEIYDSTPLLPGDNPQGTLCCKLLIVSVSKRGCSVGLTKRKTDKTAAGTSETMDPALAKEKVMIDGKVKIDDPKPVKSTAAEDEEDQQSEAMKLVDQINLFFGIGDTVADDAEWIHLTYHDRKANKVTARGKLAVSISIVPESETKTRPVGTGQDAPNVNPFLPPPFGRFSFSFNPFYLINGLCGPKVSCLYSIMAICWS